MNGLVARARTPTALATDRRLGLFSLQVSDRPKPEPKTRHTGMLKALPTATRTEIYTATPTVTVMEGGGQGKEEESAAGEQAARREAVGGQATIGRKTDV